MGFQALGCFMTQPAVALVHHLNRAIIKFCGIYSAWFKRHRISYNEMLALYTIREKGFCTQKQVCDSYLLPPQTMNHIISTLRKNGILAISEEYSTGREKAFVLTEAGQRYAKPLLDSIDAVELRSIELLGAEKLEQLTSLMLEYDRTLQQALEEQAV